MAVANVQAVGLSNNSLIDMLLTGAKWGSSSLTYSFRSVAPTQAELDEYGENYANGFAELNTTQKTAVRTILGRWSEVCNLTFSEIADTGTGGVLRFGTCSSTVVPTSCAYYPGNTEAAGDVWLGNSNDNAPDNPLAGGYDYMTIVHEIGHTLGLKHPHDADPPFPVGDAAVDAMQSSVMSYKSYVGSTDDSYVNAAGSYIYGPMACDIAAAQYDYGANFQFNSGDTVYSFSPAKDKIFETIWDGGGNDTYDLSLYTVGVTVDLNPGKWSTLAVSQLAQLNGNDAQQLAPGSICNAFLYNGDGRSLIENAVGGNGNDTLIGNQADNILNGGEGRDSLWGGAGRDYLYGGGGDDLLVVGANADISFLGQFHQLMASAGFF